MTDTLSKTDIFSLRDSRGSILSGGKHARDRYTILDLLRKFHEHISSNIS
jgi:hypothetical protein